MASQGCIDDARGEMVQSSSGGGQAMATMKMPRLALLTLVSADVVEQCRFFFTYYTQVEHLPPSDLFVVQAGAKLELIRPTGHTAASPFASHSGSHGLLKRCSWSASPRGSRTGCRLQDRVWALSLCLSVPSFPSV